MKRNVSIHFFHNYKTVSISFFQQSLLQWYSTHGRHDLPWQNQSPYHVWLSEIMLQQTQVKTVIPYFHRFISKFPSIADMANAHEDDITQMWAGLGYYHRAKNMHRTSKIIHEQFQGQFPRQLDELKKLPGIGPSTAAAISSQAFHQPHAILDGNVKRVLARFFAIQGPINDKEVVKQLENKANECMPQQQCQAYTQAIMDMGATCCKPKNPNCLACPLQGHCRAFQSQLVANIPGKAKRNPPKTLQYHFVAHHNKQHIFFEKRPQTGIWPNLWCLPHCLPRPTQIPVIRFKHQLTHQQMDIHIYTDGTSEELKHGQWFSQQDVQMIGIPKAIQHIIEELFSSITIEPTK